MKTKTLILLLLVLMMGLTACEDKNTPKISGTDNGHDYVDLGLSVCWATMNIGASAPTDDGWQFAWGELVPKNEYTWENYVFCKGTSNTLTKYCWHETFAYNGNADGLSSLQRVDDAASQLWGGKWRVPTKEEVRELFDCKWELHKESYPYYFKITGKNGKYIYLGLTKYWTSDCYYDWSAYSMFVQQGPNDHSGFGLNGIDRCEGLYIRPIYIK